FAWTAQAPSQFGYDLSYFTYDGVGTLIHYDAHAWPTVEATWDMHPEIAGLMSGDLALAFPVNVGEWDVFVWTDSFHRLIERSSADLVNTSNGANLTEASIRVRPDGVYVVYYLDNGNIEQSGYVQLQNNSDTPISFSKTIDLPNDLDQIDGTG